MGGIKIKQKILLCNWTHRNNCSGGTENRYAYLKQVFPDAELISYADLFNKGNSKIKNYKEAIKKIDEYYLKRYEEDKNILIIRDAEFGGVLDISEIPQILIFGNPYKSLRKLFGINYSKYLLRPRISEKTKKIAVSNFMKQDTSVVFENIIPNPVDIDFFKPLWNKKEELRAKYKIPRDKKVGMWVGSTDIPIKNIMVIKKLINIFGEEIFWILVSKNENKVSDEKRCKIFCKIDKETIRDLYNCVDFFILTSPIEGCNHTIFEAMSCNLPVIVSKTGYFYDFWDNRIGFRIDWNDLLNHIGSVKIIDKIKTNSRQVIIDQKLDLKNWGEKWKKIVKQL